MAHSLIHVSPYVVPFAPDLVHSVVKLVRRLWRAMKPNGQHFPQAREGSV